VCSSDLDQQVVFAEQRRVHHQLAVGVVQDGQRERHFLEAVDDLPHHVGALVAEEQAGEHLELKVRAQLDMVKVPLHGGEHQAGVTLQVVKRHTQIEILDHAQRLG